MPTPRPFDDISALRRFFRREMLRIQTASICQRAPVFDTLQHTSDLADAAIAAAYRMAVEHVAASHPPATPGYQPRQQLMVIALGRLGMREFDLASDADLVFVLPDADRAEHVFWTRVAERMIDLITAYTGDGRDVRRGHAPAAQRQRGRAGADRGGLQRILRQARRGLGRHRLHEVARRGRRHRSAPPSF